MGKRFLADEGLWPKTKRRRKAKAKARPSKKKTAKVGKKRVKTPVSKASRSKDLSSFGATRLSTSSTRRKKAKRRWTRGSQRSRSIKAKKIAKSIDIATAKNVPLSRTQTTNVLRQAAIGWAVKRRYSAYPEVCPVVGLGRRVDVMTLNTKGHLIAIEIKSCAADLKVDDKWHEYLPICHRLYFCVSYLSWNDPKFKALLLKKIKPYRCVGVMALLPDGFAKVVKAVDEDNEISLSVVRRVALKLAWLGGKSKANSRRVRYYLPDARRPRLVVPTDLSDI